ncbi:MAG: PHB depolymerase family esterase [Gammaproteobacteria bacterium]|jgi:polyhydroxybutyrate depolymerase
MFSKLLLVLPILVSSVGMQGDSFNQIFHLLESATTIPVAQADDGENRNNVASLPRDNPSLTGRSEHSVTVDLQSYRYSLYTPAGYKPATAVPLVITLSDIGTRTSRFMHYIRFNKIADRYGYAVVYPHLYQDKDLLQAVLDGKGERAAAILRQLADDVMEHRNIRKDKIYLVGFSSGGIIALDALCDLTMDIAGFAVVAASLPAQSRSQCKNARQQIPALFIAGRDDPYMRWQMGDSQPPRKIAGLSIDLLPVVTTVEYWTRRNQCDLRPLMTAVPNTDLRDGTSVTRLAYDGHCVSGYPVILYAVTGGGHTWPGNQYQPRADDAGKTSQDIDASELIWTYFDMTHKLLSTDSANGKHLAN